MELQGANSTSVPVPFTSYSIEFGLLYYPLAMIAITAIVNAFNLTDGLDGLAASVTIPVVLFYLFVAYTAGFGGNAVLLTAAAGALAGYLIFNWHPAKIMMGDTGSLFLGGLLSGAMFSMRAQLIFILCGFIYIAETLSVVIQVTYFKASKGKRFFKMAPLHHHFELCGWQEVKIVLVFATVTVALCLLSVFGV
jgi:phospho-N-acetylmuramoyl-pentapeptide-transferase